MEDSSMFLQWAMNTLHQEQQAPTAVDQGGGEANATFLSLQALREASQAAEMVQELIAEAYPTNSWSSGDGDTIDGSSAGNSNLTPLAMDHEVWPASPNSAARRGVPSRSGSGGTKPPVSWNFGAAAAQPAGSEGLMAETTATRGLPDIVYGSPPARRGGLKSSGSVALPYPQDHHIIAERKRREKINQRFIELSTVIPGLKKMDKATILSDATRYVKELQEKLKEMEAGGSNSRSNETVVVVKRPCLHASAAAPDGDGSPLSASSGTPAASKQLPEIEVRFSEGNVMVRIHCENGKAVVVKVLAEIEEVNLGIIHANVMPFSACTLIITITAKVEEGFTVTAEDIVGRLNCVLVPMHSSCSGPEETQETN